MDILKQTDLMQLIETTGEWCVSLYMPTHRVGREQQQDPIRFKNLIDRVEKKLLEYGVRKPEIKKLVRTVENLHTDRDFWQHQSDGLAVFLSPEQAWTYRLPFQFQELVAIGSNFHIKPLLPLLSQNGQFYILALSLNEIQLFLGTRDTIEEVELEDIPTSMQEALFMDDPEKHLGWHTRTRNPSAPGSQPAMFHGQGKQSDEQEKKDILRFFQYFNDGLNTALQGATIPMVLAGVDYLLPLYHEANPYSNLLPEGIEGNPEKLKIKKLHELAWKLVEPIFSETQRKAREQFEILHHNEEINLATVDLRTSS